METDSALKPQLYLYLYGIASAVPAGIGEMCGVENQSNLFVVQSGGLSCVVSNIPVSDYDSREGRVNQLEWLAPRAFRHDEILRCLGATTTIVPFKFGTLCATAGHLRDILDKFRLPLMELLDRFQGREEWSLRIQLDVGLVREHVRRISPQLGALTEPQACQSLGQTYFLNKKREKLAAGAVDEFVSALAGDLQARLQPCVVQVLCGKPSAVHQDSACTIFSAALLIDKRDFSAVEQVLRQVEREYSDYGLLTEISGPWPPYSFSAVENLEQNARLQIVG